jgi:hypothetical protein
MSASSSSLQPLAAGTEGQYCFLVEWFDAQAAMMRQYHLLYFLLDDTLEMVGDTHRAHGRRSGPAQRPRCCVSGEQLACIDSPFCIHAIISLCLSLSCLFLFSSST